MRSFYLIILSSLLIISCNSKKGKAEPEATPQDSAVVANDPANRLKQEMETIAGSLDKLAPLEQDKLKALLPAELMGGTQTSADVNNNNGASVATAEYAVNDTIKVTLSIYDCAGEAGVGIFNTQFRSLESNVQETADEYTRPVSINGARGYEHRDIPGKTCSVTWFAAKRYLVVLEGTNIESQPLRQVAGTIRLQ